MLLNKRKMISLIQDWLDEDLHYGDLTAPLFDTIPEKAWLIAKDHGVLAGIELVSWVYECIDPMVTVTVFKKDGELISKGETLVELEGKPSSLLAGERLSLNLLQRLSGIATTTARYVEQLKGTNARLVDTRKTTPGLRHLEKYAVRMGGGFNHRFGLYDAAMLKDNHIKAAGGIMAAVTQLRKLIPHTVKIEVEVETIAEVKEALMAQADIIMLDNMDVPMMREAVQLINGKALTEASGGIRIENIKGIAETGVDLISVGAITHSVAALDISMDLKVKKNRA